MTQFKHVFSPFKFGNVEVKNRIEVSPMVISSTTDGFVKNETIEFYRSFARGGSGIVTVGDSAVDFEYAKGFTGMLNLGDDHAITGLSSLAEAIKRYGAKASIEVNHRSILVPPNLIGGKNPIGVSPTTVKYIQAEDLRAGTEGIKKVQIQVMDQEMIDKVVQNFASACYRCMMAGFDMVLLHGGHGHLIAEFASPYFNKRIDDYGGSLENRARFAVEVLTAIRKKVGNKLAIEYRISADELIPGGMREEETIEFIKIIEDKIDLLHVSAGVIAEPRYLVDMIQPTYLPHAYNVHRAEKIKKAVKIPVTCIGSISDLGMAEQIIAEGKADIVAMGRAHLADPEIVKKTFRGDFEAVRPCIRCGICLNRTKNFLPIKCSVNPVLGREFEYKQILPALKKKKVVVIGGGPAGMQAATVASSRGHKVTLYEKDNKLGGALRAAAGPSFKADMKRYLDWIIRETRQSAVEVKLSTTATSRTIKALKPDALIVAVGAEPFIPDIPGIKKSHVVQGSDVDLGAVKTGKTVVVAGAGLTGCETALQLSQQGKKVTIIDMIGESEVAKDTGFINRMCLLDMLNKKGVKFKTETKLEEITDTGVRVIDKNWNRFDIHADTVVLALGVKALSATVKAFQELAPEVYVIGDCYNPRNLMGATQDAFNIAVEI